MHWACRWQPAPRCFCGRLVKLVPLGRVLENAPQGFGGLRVLDVREEQEDVLGRHRWLVGFQSCAEHLRHGGVRALEAGDDGQFECVPVLPLPALVEELLHGTGQAAEIPQGSHAFRNGPALVVQEILDLLLRRHRATC